MSTLRRPERTGSDRIQRRCSILRCDISSENMLILSCSFIVAEQVQVILYDGRIIVVRMLPSRISIVSNTGRHVG